MPPLWGVASFVLNNNIVLFKKRGNVPFSVSAAINLKLHERYSFNSLNEPFFEDN